MADVNLRKFVTDALKPLLPTAWRLVPYSTNLDQISKPVVMLKLQTIAKLPEAPNSHRTVSYVLTVIEPKITPGALDDDLDDHVVDLLAAIDDLPNFAWTKAERVLFSDSNQAYDITLEIPIRKEA